LPCCQCQSARTGRCEFIPFAPVRGHEQQKRDDGPGSRAMSYTWFRAPRRPKVFRQTLRWLILLDQPHDPHRSERAIRLRPLRQIRSLRIRRFDMDLKFCRDCEMGPPRAFHPRINLSNKMRLRKVTPATCSDHPSRAPVEKTRERGRPAPDIVLDGPSHRFHSVRFRYFRGQWHLIAV
jgi:hypothetical protein